VDWKKWEEKQQIGSKLPQYKRITVQRGFGVKDGLPRQPFGPPPNDG
jgi:hypothetical protein